MTLSGGDGQSVHQLAAPVLGVDDDRVDRVVQPSLGRGLPGPRLARQQIVGGQHDRAAGQEMAVEPLHVEPLEVDDVRAPQPRCR